MNPDLTRLAVQLEAAAGYLRSKGPGAVEAARMFASPLHSPSGARHSKGEHADPTMAAALSPELSAAWLDDLKKHARGVANEVSALLTTIHQVTHQGENEGRVSQLIACANPNCDNLMTRIGEDRPKRGRCPRCFQHLHRYGLDWTPRSNGDEAEAS